MKAKLQTAGWIVCVAVIVAALAYAAHYLTERPDSGNPAGEYAPTPTNAVPDAYFMAVSPITTPSPKPDMSTWDEYVQTFQLKSDVMAAPVIIELTYHAPEKVTPTVGASETEYHFPVYLSVIDVSYRTLGLMRGLEYQAYEDSAEYIFNCAGLSNDLREALFRNRTVFSEGETVVRLTEDRMEIVGSQEILALYIENNEIHFDFGTDSENCTVTYYVDDDMDLSPVMMMREENALWAVNRVLSTPLWARYNYYNNQHVDMLEVYAGNNVRTIFSGRGESLPLALEGVGDSQAILEKFVEYEAEAMVQGDPPTELWQKKTVSYMVSQSEYGTLTMETDFLAYQAQDEDIPEMTLLKWDVVRRRVLMVNRETMLDCVLENSNLGNFITETKRAEYIGDNRVEYTEYAFSMKDIVTERVALLPDGTKLWRETEVAQDGNVTTTRREYAGSDYFAEGLWEVVIRKGTIVTSRSRGSSDAEPVTISYEYDANSAEPLLTREVKHIGDTVTEEMIYEANENGRIISSTHIIYQSGQETERNTYEGVFELTY
ncbi:MAG: hypothetical protein J5532_03505 [Lachnospiraceae bacterium]|nr:hypothetical protein [Lachnospiraceae bacterium]